MSDIITKAVKPEDITELSVEWIIHEVENYKKLTLITNIIGGKVHTKYGVIEGGYCVFISKSQSKSLKRYNSIMIPKHISSRLNVL